MWKCHFGNATQSVVVIGNNFMKSLVSFVENRSVVALDMEQKFGTIEWRLAKHMGKYIILCNVLEEEGHEAPGWGVPQIRGLEGCGVSSNVLT
jgi:hypothetical protein